jgi:hypothetical protein
VITPIKSGSEGCGIRVEDGSAVGSNSVDLIADAGGVASSTRPASITSA